MIRRLVVFWLCMASTGALALCETRHLTGLACIKEMLLPSYGAIARRAAHPGSVISHAVVGENGKLVSLHSTARDPFLIREVETFLRYNTSFDSTCHGEEITLKFTFILDNSWASSRSPQVKIRFRGPNEFVIESGPVEPIPDLGPVPNR